MFMFVIKSTPFLDTTSTGRCFALFLIEELVVSSCATSNVHVCHQINPLQLESDFEDVLQLRDFQGSPGPCTFGGIPPPLDSGNGSPRLKDMLNFLIALDQSGFKADETIKDTQSKMLQGCFVDLQQTPNITIQEATTMLHNVKAAGIPDWMREEVAKAAQNKVAATAAEGQCNQKQSKNMTQKNLHLRGEA